MRAMTMLPLLLLLPGCFAPATYGQPLGGYYQRTYLPPLPPTPRFYAPPVRFPAARS